MISFVTTPKSDDNVVIPSDRCDKVRWCRPGKALAKSAMTWPALIVTFLIDKLVTFLHCLESNNGISGEDAIVDVLDRQYKDFLMMDKEMAHMHHLVEEPLAP
jgi:hypothetical protein